MELTESEKQLSEVEQYELQRTLSKLFTPDFISGKKSSITPKNEMVKNWTFKISDSEEALVAFALGRLAEKTGMDKNELQHAFPTILRIMKSNSNWSK